MSNPTEQSKPPPVIPTIGGPVSVLPEFRTYDLNELGIEKTRAIRQAMSTALEVVEACIPQPSRARSLVVTKLQEASMFGVLGVAELPENQVGEGSKP